MILAVSGTLGGNREMAINLEVLSGVSPNEEFYFVANGFLGTDFYYDVARWRALPNLESRLRARS